jgi:hypothetical protein
MIGDDDMSDFDDLDGQYDGVWSKKQDPYAIDSDSRLDDPDDEYGPLYEQCVLGAFNNGVNSLLRELRSGDLQVFSNQDLISLSKMYKRPWSRFVDPRYSHPANSGNSARIVLWECDRHYATLFSLKGKWEVSYRARLVEDDSIISDSELINDDDGVFEEDVDYSWSDDEIEDSDPVSAFGLEEDQERRELLDKELDQLIMLGFSKQEILETFSSAAERIGFYKLLSATAKRQGLRLSEFVDGLLDYDLFAIRKILDIAHFIGTDLRDQWLNYALGNFDFGERDLLSIEEEIFSLLGFDKYPVFHAFANSAERSDFLNQMIAHLKEAEKVSNTSGQISLQASLKNLGNIDLAHFKMWLEIGLNLTPEECANWFLLGPDHPLIFDITKTKVHLIFAIQRLYKSYC